MHIEKILSTVYLWSSKTPWTKGRRKLKYTVIYVSHYHGNLAGLHGFNLAGLPW